MDFCRYTSLFEKIISGIPSECQTDWIWIMPDDMSDLVRFAEVISRV